KNNPTTRICECRDWSCPVPSGRVHPAIQPKVVLRALRNRGALQANDLCGNPAGLAVEDQVTFNCRRGLLDQRSDTPSRFCEPFVITDLADADGDIQSSGLSAARSVCRC